MDRKQLPRLCFLISVGLTLVGAAVRTVCMLTQFDTSVGYFDTGVLSVLSGVLYFVAVVAAAVPAMLIPKGTLSGELRTPYRTPFAIAVGLVLAAFTVLSFITSYDLLFTKGGFLRTVVTLSALLSATYFFLSAGRHGRFRDGLVLTGFLPFVWAMSAVAVTYSDVTVAMNSPIKFSLHMGLLGFMFILLSELRFRLGKPAPRAAIALTGIGVFTTLNAALPILIGATVTNHILYTLCAGVLLPVGLYGGYMLFCYTFRPALPLADTAETDMAADAPDFSDSDSDSAS